MKKVIYILCILSVHFHTNAQKENLLWVKKFGTSSFDITKSISTDKDGNVYVFGQYEELVDFDPEGSVNMLSALGYSDIFLVKLNAQGELIWATSMGGLRIDIASQIALDKNKNCYLVGSFENAMDADPGPVAFNLISKGGRDAFIIKLDVNGKFQWAKSLGSASYDNAVGVCTDSISNCYIIGDFQDSIDADPGAGLAKLYARANADIFILKLDTYGNYQWAKSVGGKIADYGKDISIDHQNNIIASGYFRDTVDFDPSLVGVDLIINAPPPFTVPPTLDYNTFVWKLDANGNHIWAKQLDGSNETTSSTIKIDKLDNIIVAGSFKGSTDFDPSINTLMLTGINFDGYVTKLTTNGNLLWAKQFAGIGDCHVNALSIDTAMNIYSTGNFSYSTDFDPGAGVFSHSVSGTNANTFISKLNKEGDYVFSKHFKEGSSGGTAIFVDDEATVYTGGGFGNTVNFHPDAVLLLTSSGLFDAFVHKMSQCPGTQFVNEYYTVCDSLVIHDTVYKVSGTYTDTIVNALGCDTISSIQVTINKADIIGNIKQVSCQKNNDGEITISGNGIFFQLNPGQITNNVGIFSQLTPAVYTIQVTDSNGCKARQIFSVQQLSCCDDVFVPTAFTPNKDLLNDEFSFYNAYGIRLADFQIRNRFGEMVFSTHIVGDAWNGNYKGTKAELGTYYYFIRYTCLSSGKEYIKKGEVVLIR